MWPNKNSSIQFLSTNLINSFRLLWDLLVSSKETLFRLFNIKDVDISFDLLSSFVLNLDLDFILSDATRDTGKFLLFYVDKKISHCSDAVVKHMLSVSVKCNLISTLDIRWERQTFWNKLHGRATFLLLWVETGFKWIEVNPPLFNYSFIFRIFVYILFQLQQ